MRANVNKYEIQICVLVILLVKTNIVSHSYCKIYKATYDDGDVHFSSDLVTWVCRLDREQVADNRRHHIH